ncbi:MAG: YitT family protein [Clostridiales bacterium]|nr:YitT family protein [Clostridiales bacterium]
MKPDSKKTLKTALDFLKILLGSVIFAIGIQFFFHPATLLSGGVTGIAMIVNYLTGAPVGIMIVVINIPLFIIAFRNYGWSFMAGSLWGMLTSSVAIDLLSFVTPDITAEPFLAAVYGGILTGLGLGIVYTTGSTTGGTDVIAKLIREKFPYVNFGTMILALDGAVIAAYAAIFRKYENAMYTVIAVYIAARVIDLVLYGSSQSKLCHIISEHSDDIKMAIVQKLHRGVTVLQGKGAYSGQDKQILLCVVKRQQIVEIKKIVKNIDQRAFVIVTDTRDVFGEGFGDISIDK